MKGREMIGKINIKMAVSDLAAAGKEDESRTIRDLAQRLSTVDIRLFADGHPIESFIVGQFLEALAAGTVDILDPGTGKKINESRTTWDSMVEVARNKSAPLKLLDFNTGDLCALYGIEPLKEWQYGRPYNDAGTDETRAERGRRLVRRKSQLKNEGKKNYIQTIAREEKLSTSRVKQLIEKAEDGNAAKNTSNGWAGLATPARQTSHKKR
ncbi:MAG: hypothetical protein ACRETC_08590 [Gammaproteobacteria bacterium]